MYDGCPKMNAMSRAMRANYLGADGFNQESIMSADAGAAGTAALDWKEVWYTHRPVVSASNVDEALRWGREESRTSGVQQFHQGRFEPPIAA
jgi:hypothetical protein